MGIARTDASGEVPAPAGVLTVSVSGDGQARVELDEVELAPDEVIDLILDLVDIDDEGGEGGGGEGGRDGEAGSGGEDGEGGGGGRGGSVSPGSCSHPDAEGTVVPVTVDIESQADVDALAGCTSVGGIDIGFGAAGFTSLAGLESLTEVRMVPDSLSPDVLDVFSGNIDIRGAADLTDVSALANLTHVDGHVSIDLPGVREVDLSSLESLGTGERPSLPGVVVSGELVALVDLSSLERVVGEVHFTAEGLDTLLLPRLQTIELDQDGYRGGFIISSSSRLTTLELPELTTVEGEFWVYWCDALTAIQAPKLTEVRHHFRIDDNPALVTIGLDSVVEPTGGIYVSGNTVLESIGLNGVPSVQDTGMAGLGDGSVSIEYNPALTQLGFAALTSIAGELSLSVNAMLSSEVSQAFRDRVTVGGGN